MIDNATFACIILLFLGAKVLHSKELIHNILDGHYQLNTALVVTMCSDVLHNIMHSSTRLWNLNRIDLTDFFQSNDRDFRFVAFYLTAS